jgi:DDE superfamily endonuclease
MPARGIGRLHVINGMVDADKHITGILKPKLLPSAKDMFGTSARDRSNSFVFQQDSAPCHTAKTVKAWFARNKVNVLDWPGNSPDLNPIANSWFRLKRVVRERHSTNKRQLIETIIFNTR